jgi:hypothetical protein
MKSELDFKIIGERRQDAWVDMQRRNQCKKPIMDWKRRQTRLVLSYLSLVIVLSLPIISAMPHDIQLEDDR